MTDRQIPDRQRKAAAPGPDDIRPDPVLAEIIAPAVHRGRQLMRDPVFSAVIRESAQKRRIGGRQRMLAGLGAGIAAALTIAVYNVQPHLPDESVESISASIPQEKSGLYEAAQVFLAASWHHEGYSIIDL